MEIEKVEEIVNKWLLLEDKGIVKILISSIIANKLPGDPVWLFLVAGSGGTKTELIRGLSKIENVYFLSDLTPQTFLSGDTKNKNASLLLRLPKESILILKDFTTVLTMHHDKKQYILSQLREIYDGFYRKEFGTGESKSWEGKIGFIAGVTSIIDTHYSIYQVLGERFIQYRLVQPDEIELAKKTMEKIGKEKEMRKEIQEAFANFVNSIKIPDQVSISDMFKDKIAYLSAICVKARSGVIRENYYSREIELIPEPELPTRFSKQLITLSSGLMVVNGDKFSNNEYKLIFKTAMDSIPIKRRSVIELLAKTDDYIETSDISTEIGYPVNTIRRTLEELNGLKLIDRKKPGKGLSDNWILSPKTKEYLHKALPDNTPGDISGKITFPEKTYGDSRIFEIYGKRELFVKGKCLKCHNKETWILKGNNICYNCHKEIEKNEI